MTAGEAINWRKLYNHTDLKTSCEALCHDHMVRVFIMGWMTEPARNIDSNSEAVCLFSVYAFILPASAQ